MKIVTYNLRYGGKDRAHWREIIRRFEPELLLVQESFAPAEHLPRSANDNRCEHAVWNPVTKTDGNVLDWGSGVYCKGFRPVALEVPGESGWITGAEVDGFSFLDTPPRRLRAFSLHAATGRGSYAAVVNGALDQLLRFREDCDLVIAGDFNLTISPRHESEKRTTSAADLKIQQRLREEFGLVNCWSRCNAVQPLSQTLRWSNDPKEPFHCDGIFVPTRWAELLRSCAVQADDGWNALSDHNPIVAEFV